MELLARDTISGQQGKATAVINGQVEDLFFLKDLEAKFVKNKVDVKTLGNRGTQKKAVGWDGSGAMTVYYVTSLFRKLALEYINKGKDFYFTMTVTNEDESATIGRQTITLYDCNLDEVILAKMDTNSAILEESMNFTFSGADMGEAFSKPRN